MPLYAANTISSTVLRTATDDFQPQDYGLKAWNFDPATCSRANALPAGQPAGSLIWIPAGVVTNLGYQIAAAGATLTAAENFAALYSAAGALLGVTADQSTAWTTTGSKVSPLTTPYTVTAGFYYVLFLANGTTPPAVESGTGSGVVNFTGIATPRAAVGPSSQTTMPATVSLTAATGASAWVGVS